MKFLEPEFDKPCFSAACAQASTIKFPLYLDSEKKRSFGSFRLLDLFGMLLS